MELIKNKLSLENGEIIFRPINQQFYHHEMKRSKILADVINKRHIPKDIMKLSINDGLVGLVKYLQYRWFKFDKHDLPYAGGSNNIKMLKYLIKKYPNVKVDRNLLIHAIENGKLEMVKYLLENYEGLVVNRSELDMAIKSGNLELVKYFIEVLGIQFNKAALNSAVISDNMEMVKYFQGNRLSVNPTVLQSIFRHGNLEMLKYVIKMQSSLVKHIDGFYASIFAIKSGNLELVKYLTEKYELFEMYENIVNMLQTAVISGNVEMFRYFHEKYPNVNIGKNMLINAVVTGNLDMFKCLIKTYNLQVSVLNLQLAAKNGHLEMVKYILEISPNLKLVVDDNMKLVFDVFYFTV